MGERVEFGEPTLGDVHGEFAGWDCFRDASGLCFARLTGRPREPGVLVRGEDPLDLRDSIIRWISRNEEERTSLD